MADESNIMVDDEPRLTVEEIYQALEASTNSIGPQRTEAEGRLKHWESSSKRGFVVGLLQVIREYNVSEDLRLLAAVVAKNSVGSSWRKTLATREWSRVPADEKAELRATILPMLLNDPSRRVAVQLSLLIANVARFDFPNPWTTMMEELVGAAALNGPTSFPQKERALMALKHVVRALRHKRIVIETPANGRGHVSREELGGLALQIATERNLLNQGMIAIFPAIMRDWRAASVGMQQNLEVGLIVLRSLQVLRELLLLIPNLEGIENDVQQLMEQLLAVSGEILKHLPGGVEEGAQAPDPMQLVMTKAFERMAQCVLAAEEKHTVDFARYLPPFVDLYHNAALLAMDARMVQRARPKRRVVLVRFLSAALGNTYYGTNWARTQRRLLAETPDRGGYTDATLATVEAAAQYIDQLMANSEAVSRLLEQVISKYVQLSPEELEDWQNDPEDYVRSADIEASPDADTPRPYGIKLLLAMLDRGGNGIAALLLSNTAALMQQQQTLETVFLREACYRVIGEASDNPAISSNINFTEWYNNELSGLLRGDSNQAPEGLQGSLAGRVLQARAIWLVGVMGGRLPPDSWTQALGLVAAGLSHTDLVVALTSVSSLIAMAAGLLEDKELLRALEEQPPPSIDDNALEEDAQAAELRTATPGRMLGLEAGARSILIALFQLLTRLTEMECMVRVLQLVSVLVELLGEHVVPHLGIITSALPTIWRTANSDALKLREGGAPVRLQSALIAVVTHLVSRIGIAGFSDAEVGKVLWELVTASTNPANSEAENLMDEAFRLIQAVISACPTLPPALQDPDFLKQLIALLQQGKNNRALLLVFESYLLIAPAALIPYLPQLGAAVQGSVVTAFNRLTEAAAHRRALPDEAVLGANNDTPGFRASEALKESVPEAMVAASLTITMMTTCPDSALPHLVIALRAMAEVVGSDYVDGDRLGGGMPPALSTLCDGFLEVLGRVVVHSPAALPQLLARLPHTAVETFMDRWLFTAIKKQLDELFGPPAAAAAGRLRRRLAAAAFCCLLCASPPDCMRNGGRLVKALHLCLIAQNEEESIRRDKEDFIAIIRDLQEGGGDAPVDHTVLRRLQLTVDDPIRTFDLRTAVPVATQAAARLVPEPQLLEIAAVAGGGVESWLRSTLHPEFSAPVPMA